MEALAAERGDECQAKKGSLRWNARKLLELGEVPAIREIADRLDGKVTQGISGPEGGPIQTIEITRLKGMSNEELEVLERALIQIGLAEGDQGGEREPEE